MSIRGSSRTIEAAWVVYLAGLGFPEHSSRMTQNTACGVGGPLKQGSGAGLRQHYLIAVRRPMSGMCSQRQGCVRRKSRASLVPLCAKDLLGLLWPKMGEGREI